MSVIGSREFKLIMSMEDQTKHEREELNRYLGSLGTSADKVSGKLATMASAFLASASLKELTSSVMESVSAFAEVEASTQRLDTALQMRGMESAKTGLEDLASKLQHVAGIDGDLVTQLEAELVSQGKSEAQVRRMIVASAGLASATDGNLRGAIEKLNGTLGGQAEELGKNNDEIKNLTLEQLKSGAAIDIVLSKYEGFIGKTGTTQIALNVAKESINDLKESLGQGLAPVIAQGAITIGGLAEALSAIPGPLKITAGIITTALIGALAAFAVRAVVLTAAKWGLFGAEMAVNAAMAVGNPILWVGIGAAVAAVAATGLLVAAKVREANATKESNSAMTSGIKVMQDYAGALALTKSSSDQYAAALDKLSWAQLQATKSDLMGQIAKGNARELSTLQAKLAVVNQEIASFNDRAEASSAAAVKAQKAANDAFTADMVEWKDKLIQQSGDKGKILDAERAQALAKLSAQGLDQLQYAQASALVDEYYNNEKLQIQKDAAKEQAKALQDSLTSWSDKLLQQKGDQLAILDQQNQEALASLREKLTNEADYNKAAALVDEYYNNERIKAAKEAADQAAAAQQTTDLSGANGLGSALMAQLKSQGAEVAGGGLASSAAGGPMAMIISAIAEFATKLQNVMALMSPMNTILQAIFEVLGPVINNLLAPLVGVLKIVGYTIGKMLIPVLELLRPIIELIAAAFVFLYNNIIVPVVNFVIGGLNKLYNAFADWINGILDMLDNIPLIDISYRVSKRGENDGMLSAIDVSDVSNAGAASDSGGSSGSGASYAAGTTIKIEMIQINAGAVVGETGLNKLALIIRDEIEEAERLGK